MFSGTLLFDKLAAKIGKTGGRGRCCLLPRQTKPRKTVNPSRRQFFQKSSQRKPSPKWLPKLLGAALDSGAPSAVGVMQLPSSIGRVSRTQGLLWNCLPDAVWAECRGAALRTTTPPASKSGGRPWDSTLWLCENATAPLARCLSTARGTRHRALNPNSGAAIATLSKDGAQQHAVFTAAGRHSFSLWPRSSL